MKLSALERMTNMVRDCQRSGVTRQVLLVRADRLPPELSRPHHLRLAEDSLIPLLGANRALRFELPGPRYAVTWRGEAEAELLDVLRALEVLLSDAPPGTPPLEDLVFLFDLPHQSELLLSALHAGPESVAAPERIILPGLDTDSLAGLETRLLHANVARFARRKPVWRLDADVAPSLAWEKRTLSVQELTAGLLPGCDVRADAWLFRRLTRALDRRMLALLASPGELAGVRPFSLDLNIASVLSPEFLRFDTALPPPLRGRVIIELMPADIMADPASFMFARGFARARGYRLMLRNLTPELLRMLSVEALELDHLQLRWTTGLAEADAKAIGALQPGRMVLFRADGPEALEWGARAGIRLYQGAAADRAGLGERSHAA
jgi:hypothetical protein